MDFKDFILLLEQKESFPREQLDPVIIQKPQKGGQGQAPPPPKGGGEANVEIHNVGEPPEGQEQQGQQKGNKAGDSKEAEGEKEPTESGEGADIERKKAGGDEKEGKGKGKGKPGKGKHPMDSHEILEKSQQGEAKDIAEKIFDRAKQKRQEANVEGRGQQEGHFMEKLSGIYEPRVDWKKELKKKINSFKSKSASAFDRALNTFAQKYKEGEGTMKSRSYFTWVMNPRAHSKTKAGTVMAKGPWKKAPVVEVVLIIALDTSGSMGGETFSKVFGEMDKIAKQFERGISAGSTKMQGQVYLMAWDTQVQKVEKYKTGEWKKYISGEKGIAGRGGTDIGPVYKYLNDHLVFDQKKTKGAGVFNPIKKPTEGEASEDNFMIPMKRGEAQVAPFIVFATDGMFGQVNDSDLGKLYKDNKESIVYLIIDGTDEYCYPENVIKYDEYRV
jgi:predicted metal-dependent peptidase